jgi:outer membrane protein
MRLNFVSSNFVKYNFRKSLFLKASIFGISCVFAGSAFSANLEEVLAKAYTSNPDLLAQRQALMFADEEMPKALAGYLPTANTVFSFDKTRTTDGNTSGNFSRFRTDLNTQSTSVRASQNLFAGGQTYYSVKNAGERIEAARYNLEKTEQEFLFFAIDAYVEVIHAKKVLDLSENNEKVLKEQLVAVEERFEVGDATKTDVSQSEARFSNSTSARVIAEGDFIAATARFKRLYQMEIPEDLQMPANLPKIPDTLDAALTIANEKNYEVKIAEHSKNAAESDVKVQRSQILPRVDLTARSNDGESVSSAFISSSQTNVASLDVTVPLYAGSSAFSAVRQAKDRARQSKYSLDNTTLGVKNNVVDAWQGIITTDTNIQSTKKSLEASEIALNGVKEEQKEGTRTILDVLDAEQEKFQAEVSHARAIKDSVLAVYRLKATIGELTPQELNLPVAKYDKLEHYDKTKFKVIGF